VWSSSENNLAHVALRAAAGWRGDAEFVVRRRQLLDEHYTGADETVAMTMRESSCRFVIDAAEIYRFQSDLFDRVTIKLPENHPAAHFFFRTDEPERLRVLLADNRFTALLDEWTGTFEFGALAVAAARDPRIPLATAARDLRESGGDVMMLSRRGADVPHRTEAEIEQDLDRLMRLRQFLSQDAAPQVDRARVPFAIEAIVWRAVRMVVLFVAIIALMALVGWIAWQL
jgi:hypothetical protein